MSRLPSARSITGAKDWDLAIISTAAPDSSFQRLTAGPGNDRLPDWKP